MYSALSIYSLILQWTLIFLGGKVYRTPRNGLTNSIALLLNRFLITSSLEPSRVMSVLGAVLTSYAVGDITGLFCEV